MRLAAEREDVNAEDERRSCVAVRLAKIKNDSVRALLDHSFASRAPMMLDRAVTELLAVKGVCRPRSWPSSCAISLVRVRRGVRRERLWQRRPPLRAGRQRTDARDPELHHLPDGGRDGRRPQSDASSQWHEMRARRVWAQPNEIAPLDEKSGGPRCELRARNKEFPSITVGVPLHTAALARASSCRRRRRTSTASGCRGGAA